MNASFFEALQLRFRSGMIHSIKHEMILHFELFADGLPRSFHSQEHKKRLPTCQLKVNNKKKGIKPSDEQDL